MITFEVEFSIDVKPLLNNVIDIKEEVGEAIKVGYDYYSEYLLFGEKGYDKKEINKWSKLDNVDIRDFIIVKEDTIWCDADECSEDSCSFYVVCLFDDDKWHRQVVLKGE